MGVKQNIGGAIMGTAFLGLSVLGLIIHVWTIIIAFMVKGFLAAVISFVVPVIAQIYWFFKIGSNSGYLNNWFCLAIIAYIGLWGIVFAGNILVSAGSES